MPRVIGTLPTGKPKQYKFRYTWLFRNAVLQIGEEVQPWDTNTGQYDGPPYIMWWDATPAEAEAFLREKGRSDDAVQCKQHQAHNCC